MATKKKTISKTKKKKTSGTSSKKKVTKRAAAPREGEETHAAAGAETRPARASKAAAVRRNPIAPRTFFPKWGEGPNRWRLVDAANQPLGRLSTRIAMMLMGKDKPSYTRHSDTGDFVVVINASKVVLTGNKLEAKLYQYHTNYPGGLKTFTAKEAMEKFPERLIEWAVYGMLPKGHMGRRWYKKLRVFAGADHPHAAQKPEAANLPNLSTRETA